MSTPEEQRALEYQANEKRREAFQRSLQALLKAPSTLAQRQLENWKPKIGRRSR